MPSLTEKPAGGDGPGEKAKREDHSGGLRADAKWVVLLGVLSAAVTVLAYLGVQWPTLMHIFTGAAASSTSPSPSATQPTQPAPTSPVPASLAPSSPLPTQPSPTPDPDSPVGPGDFNNVATDPTQVSVATMLPHQYNDSGIDFDRTSGSVQPCPIGNETAGVSDTLSRYGCTSEVIGTYLDSSMQIQVTVWVIPLPDLTNAEGVYNTLTASSVPNDWGLWCPNTGAGSQVCQEPWHGAAEGVQINHCHRYLMRALALYVDLQSGSTVLPVLTSAADAAVGAIGPQLIPVAQCSPSTAGG